ncbi:MAG: hypothetical protein EOP08_05835 [Proteobacteria bacterium]|nr:MAG: hypothetical protein EOP08_05835 [Pseudomonadota bacterium]
MFQSAGDALLITQQQGEGDAATTSLVQVLKTTGAKTTLVQGFRQIKQVAVVGSAVFFLGLKTADEDWFVWKVGVGGKATKLSVATGSFLGAISDGLYFVTQGADGDHYNLSLMPSSGAKPTGTIGLSAYNGDERSIGSGASIFYFVGSDLRRVDTAAKTDAAFSADVSGVHKSMAADATHVYWASTGPTSGATDGTVWRAPLTGGQPQLLAGAQHRPWSLAVDDEAIYWIKNASGGAGAVMKLRKNGHSARPIVRGLNNPTDVVVDASNIYWLGDGAISVTEK